jgi:general secretion pathway protein L
MAHAVIGIDLGAWSAKFVVVETGFRQSRLTDAFEEPILAGEAPLGVRQAEALQRGLERVPREATSFVALPGDMLVMRLLDLPFADVRKVEQVVGYEFEGQIMHALQDLVFDHAVVTIPGAIGASVFAVGAKIDDLAGYLAEIGTQGLDPRSLYAAPVVYQALYARAPTEEGTLPASRVLLDIGHDRTNVCVLQGGHTIFARTITRGGAALTSAVAEAARCDVERATDIKHRAGFVASAALPATTTEERQMDAVLRPALAPLVRDLRQTLASVRSRVKVPIEAIQVCGGTAGLRGLPEMLAEELELPASLWTADPEPADGPPAGAGSGTETRFALASAIGWAGARGRKEIDLRRGPFVYRASFSLLRQKAVHLSALAAAVLLSITLDAAMALGRLSSEREQLQMQLKAATTELFGQPNLDGRQVANLLKRGFKEEMAPIPKATAFDLLDEVSRKMPPADRIKLDIQELTIQAKKTTLRGTVDSAAAVDEIVSKLQTIDCFEEINKGSINEVSGGAKQFALTIASKCP